MQWPTVALLLVVAAVALPAALSLECYQCMGYDSKYDENPETNNKNCVDGAFNSKGITTINVKGFVVLCFQTTIEGGWANEGKPVTIRGIFVDNRTVHHGRNGLPMGLNHINPALLNLNNKEGSLRVSSGGSEFSAWCDNRLCNTASIHTSTTLFVLLAAMLPALLYNIFV